MAFPATTVVPPTLANFQAFYNGVTFGVGAYSITEIDGLTANAPIKFGDTQRPRDQGEFPGLDIYAGRDFTVTGAVISDGTSLQHALQLLGSSLQVSPGGTTELPFYLQLPNLPLLVTMAKCRKWTYPLDVLYGAIARVPVNIAFHSTDPRIYTTPTNSTTCGLPTPGIGAGFPWTFNLSFGGGTGGNTITVANTGNFEMRPLIVINGPVLNPIIANGSIAGNPSLQFGFQMNLGDQLVVDLDAHTATLNGTSSRLNTLQPGFNWWNLPANTSSVLSFNSQDTTSVAGTMTVQAPAGAWVL